jgi:hypothetical protein
MSVWCFNVPRFADLGLYLIGLASHVALALELSARASTSAQASFLESKTLVVA